MRIGARGVAVSAEQLMERLAGEEMPLEEDMEPNVALDDGT
jgi:hypothetical protein